MNYTKKSFAVSAPGTRSYAENWERTFRGTEGLEVASGAGEANYTTTLTFTGLVPAKWRAVQCCRISGEWVDDQFNVVRIQLPHDGRSFFSDGSPMFSYDHYREGGFSKARAEELVEYLNQEQPCPQK